MRSSFKAETPGKIEMTLTLTMPLEQWIQLRGQLVTRWPSWEVAEKINSLVSMAAQTFYPREAPEPEEGR